MRITNEDFDVSESIDLAKKKFFKKALKTYKKLSLLKKEDGSLYDNIEDFLSNRPKQLDLKLDFKYRIIEHKSNHNIGEYYKNIYRPVVSYKLQRFHLVKNDGMPMSDSYDDISIKGITDSCEIFNVLAIIKVL